MAQDWPPWGDSWVWLLLIYSHWIAGLIGTTLRKTSGVGSFCYDFSTRAYETALTSFLLTEEDTDEAELTAGLWLIWI